MARASLSDGVSPSPRIITARAVELDTFFYLFFAREQGCARGGGVGAESGEHITGARRRERWSDPMMVGTFRRSAATMGDPVRTTTRVPLVVRAREAGRSKGEGGASGRPAPHEKRSCSPLPRGGER